MYAAQSDDRSAIMRVIEAECAAYLAKDFDALARHWAHESFVRRFLWHGDVGMKLNCGWDEESAMQRQMMRRFSEAIPDDVVRDWQVILVEGDMAYVVFDQHSAQTGNPAMITGTTHEMRVMIRRDGRWLIAATVNLKPWTEVAEHPVIRVDPEGRVLWQNPQAESRLAAHAGLRISAGLLRARARGADRNLQAAIAWAAGGLTPMAKRATLKQMPDTGGAIPVLDDRAAAPAVLCWVTPADGMVLVILDDEAGTEHRIAAAAAVFRLSPAQARLVRLLMAGRDLAQTAAEMSISINTARTQLHRIFEKTGVHTQAALLRLMLSIAPPLS